MKTERTFPEASSYCRKLYQFSGRVLPGRAATLGELDPATIGESSLQVAKALYPLPSRTEDVPPEAAEPEEPSDRPPPPEDRPDMRPTRSSAPRDPPQPRKSDQRSRSPVPRRAEPASPVRRPPAPMIS